MSRAISPKLSIGLILNDVPPKDLLPPIKSISEPIVSIPSPRHSPAPPLMENRSDLQYHRLPEKLREQRFPEDAYYGRPMVPIYAPYDSDRPVPIMNVGNYQPVYGFYPPQEYNNPYYGMYHPKEPHRYQQKSRRFRRRYYQIHRKYKCSFEGCSKSYGSLNHLNTHIVTKQHGQRKCKSDFRHAEEEHSERNDHALPRSEDEKKEAESPSELTETVPALAPVPAFNQTPKNYALPLPPIFNSDLSSVRLPLLPSIISQCTSS